MADRHIQIIEKIIIHAKKILSYSQNVSEEDFLADDLLIEACMFNLIQLGEQARLLDDDYMAIRCNIPWREIRGLRNRIVHDYEGIDLPLIWDIINNDLVELARQLGEIG